MGRLRLSVASCLCFIGFLSHALCAQAQDDARVSRAARLFDEARALMADKRYADACHKLEESELLDLQLGTQLHLASCYERLGRIASAWYKYGSAVEFAAERNRAGHSESREQVARKRMAALEQRLSKLRIHVAEPMASGLRIECGGRELIRGEWDVDKPLDPGQYAITASAPDRKSWSDTFTLREGGRQVVEVPVLEPVELEVAVQPRESLAGVTPLQPQDRGRDPHGVASAPLPYADTSEPSGSLSPLSITGYVAAGLGVISIASAVLYGLDVQSGNDELAKLCVAGAARDSCATQSDLDAFTQVRDDARGAQTRQMIFYAAGGVLLAGGITLIALAPKSSHATSMTLKVAPQRSELVLRGAF